MKKKVSKVLAIIISVLIVFGGSYYAYKKYSSKSTSVSSTRYSLAKVTKSNLDITVQATGTVTGADAVNVFSFNTGVIEGMTAKQGESVNKGDLFCKINDDTTKDAVENAKTALDHSKLELQALEDQMDSLVIKAPIDGKIKTVFVAPGDDVTSMKSTYGGMAVMLVGGAGNVLETNIPFPSSGKVMEVYTSAGKDVKKGDTLFKLDDTSLKNSIATKNNEIEQAQNTLNSKEEDLAKSTITTPISGIVSVLSIKNGEIVDNTKLIATITDTSTMTVTLPVDELDINKVQVGQNATIKIDDIDGKNFTGKVQSISQSGTTTNNVTTYDVIVSIDNPENVKVAMNANVSIAVQSKENVLTVPVEAIIERNGKKYVMLSNGTQKSASSNKKGNNSAAGKLVEVETGIKNKTNIEILSGLKENETVMTALPASSTKTSTKNQGGMGGGMSGGGAPRGN
jgi:HlyD family secretion protein